MRAWKTHVAVLSVAVVAALSYGVHGVSWESITAASKKGPIFELPIDTEESAPSAIVIYCSSCHQRGRSGIDFDDARLTLESMRQDPSTWKEVARRLRDREMPPRKFPQPTENERRALIAWIDQEVVQKAIQNSNGNLMAKRLDRSEYVNLLRDLLGVRYQPSKEFPIDATGWTRCDELEISTDHLAQYRAAAEQVLDQAFAAATNGI